MLPWLRTLPSDAVVAADFEPLFWLHTGRTCVPLYVHGYHGREVTLPTAAEQRAYLERQGVTHIVIAGYVSESAPELDALLGARSEEHTSELQSQSNLVCRLLLEK